MPVRTHRWIPAHRHRPPDPVRRPGLLGTHGFRQLFVATAISQVGSQLSLLALPLVAVLALHASTFEVGLLSACGTLGFLLIGLPAGAWVDRMRRRTVLIVADLGRALVLSTVPLAAAVGALSVTQLYAVALTTGVLTVFFDVAYQSYLPQLVGPERLAEGNARFEAARFSSQVTGPTIAGLVVQVLTAPVAVGLDALSFLGSALFIRRIRTREEPPARPRASRLATEVGEGLRFVFGNPMLRAIALSIASYNLLSAIRVSMLVVLLAKELKLPAGTIGLFYSVSAVGGLLGALAAPGIAARIGQGPAIWLPLAVAAPVQLLIPLARPGWLLWLAAVAYLVVWFCVAVNNITQVSLRQRLTPERLLGRMNATMRFLVWGTTPIGGFAGGLIGQLFGPRPALWLAAAGGVIPVLPLIRSPLRRMRTLSGGG